MKKIRFEEMLPDELLRLQKEEKPVYMPVGSMEWHSLHLGMGVDTIHAEGVAVKLAEKLGGAVFPPLYIGTESIRTPDSLKRLGFQGNEEIRGMDFPENSIKSCYWPPEMFEMIISQQVKMLLDMGFHRIVILNGHGAAVQKKILQRICEKYSGEENKLLSVMVLLPDCGAQLGHAGLAETALMQALRPEAVNLEKLPQKPERLLYKTYGIADAGGHETEHFVHYDPRDATSKLGYEMLLCETEKCEKLIREVFEIEDGKEHADLG